MMNVKSLLTGIFLCVGMLNVQAQLLLDENFSYGITTGDSLTNLSLGGANWKRHSGTGGPVLYSPTSLTYAGYAGSGIGGAVTFAHASTSKEDANRALSTTVNSGNVYVSFLLNVTNSGGTTGDYAFHLNDSAGNTISSIFRAKMFLKDGSIAGTYKIGFAKGGAATLAAFAPNDYNLNQTYLVVVKYMFNTATAADDSVFATVISSGVPSVEPAYSMVCTDITQSDLAKIKSVCIRQGTVGTGGATIDGLRVATSWSDLIGGAVASAPSPVTGLTFTGLTKGSARISFAKNISYNAAKMKVLVFMKKDLAIVSGSPNKAVTNYTANTIIGGTPYQHDAIAFCVMNGDTNQAIVTNLVAGSTYHLLAYVVSTDDSLYSTAAVASGASSLTPAAVTSVMFTSGGQTSAWVKWAKPASFDNTNSTVLVFAKATAAITGTVTLTTAANYTANSIFTSAPQSLGGDATARCIYNATGDSVLVTGLTTGTTYYVTAFVGRNGDSTYSGGTSTSGSTDGLVTPPGAASNVQFSGVAHNVMNVNWTKPANYVDSTMTTLVFMKAGSAVNAGTNTYAAAQYNSNVIFGSGTKYQHDSNAFCIYKGDSGKVSTINLLPLTGYYVAVYVVRDADTVYSAAATSDKITLQLPPQLYTISSINKVNVTTGVPDSLNIKVVVKGLVYGVNQRASGIQIVLRDSTGGITLFNSAKNFGYTTVAEGDELEATGTITSFRGLIELSLDTIMMKASGKTLKTPTLVTKVEEVSENDLIRINTVKFITPPAGGVWPLASTNISVTNALNDTIVLRVLSTFPIAGKPLPTTPTFNVIGLGVQFSTSAAAPFLFNGYQLFPRTQSDIIPIPVVTPDSLSPFHVLSPANNDTIVLTNTNLTDTVLLSWTVSVNSNGIDTTTYTFILDTVGADFSDPRFEMMTGINHVLPLTKGTIHQMATLNGIASGQLFAGIWEVKAESKSLVRYSDSYRNLFILNSVTTGIAEQTRLDAISLYPNPAHGSVIIRGLVPHQDIITIVGITGKTELTVAATENMVSLPTGALSAGIYFVKVQSGEAISIRKLIIQ